MFFDKSYLDDEEIDASEGNEFPLRDIQGRPLAFLRLGGLICDQDRFPHFTSKDFAVGIKASIWDTPKFSPGLRGGDIVTLELKGSTGPVTVIKMTSKTIELLCDQDMKLFDQHVFSHLQNIWGK